MALVRGKLTDSGYNAMWASAVRLEFDLDGVATNTEGTTITTKKQVVIPETNGTWEVPLMTTDSMIEDRYYSLTVRWLNGESVPIGLDFPTQKFKVPEGVHDYKDLITASASNPLQVFFQPTAPIGWPRGSVWVNTVTGDVNRKRA